MPRYRALALQGLVLAFALAVAATAAYRLDMLWLYGANCFLLGVVCNTVLQLLRRKGT